LYICPVFVTDDHSLVRLKRNPPKDDSDYINASYIEVNISLLYFHYLQTKVESRLCGVFFSITSQTFNASATMFYSCDL